jgi:hypothetical protein
VALYGLLDPLKRGGPHAWPVVKHPINCGKAHPGRPGNVAKGFDVGIRDIFHGLETTNSA